eukprot:CAMPEP_0197020892 /NCGR_PEP_ID=MMETSP1384-20130603/1759_1 /TAXON_ID=29189 /ORGANISM="Ammonia sp." /LENGTH=224 /DNA_ID=CAMNT_0042448615 /DNA_START=59 /DNA_END=733 /DNA_ORIENTATION=+
MANRSNDDDNYSIKYTLFVLGPGAVGKTSLVIRFLSDDFRTEYEPTIEDFYRKTIEVDRIGCVNLEIYDTAGQQEFSTMQDEYYRTGDGFLLVYNITSGISYNGLQDTYNKLLKARSVVNENGPPPPIVVAGNKCDLTHLRQVTVSDGKKLANQWDCPFFETSAKEKINNLAIFEELVRQIERKKKTKPKPPSPGPTSSTNTSNGNTSQNTANGGGGGSCCTIL